MKARNPVATNNRNDLCDSASYHHALSSPTLSFPCRTDQSCRCDRVDQLCWIWQLIVELDCIYGPFFWPHNCRQHAWSDSLCGEMWHCSGSNLKHPIKRCHLKKGILRTNCSPHTEWKPDSGPTQRRCLLLLPPASSIDVIVMPPLAAAIVKLYEI